jgi:branched-chain amino acid transport system ATP-binding protein
VESLRADRQCLTASFEMPNDTILTVKGVTVTFGGITALDDVSFGVSRGSIVGLIGPNGAGKTTMFNCLSRAYTPAKGEIVFNGKPLLNVPAHHIASAGIGRTFQNLAMFSELSVLDNVRIGAHSRFPSTLIKDMFGRSGPRNERAISDQALRMIDYLNLAPVMHLKVGDLPFGTQKRVEMARSLAMDPSLLLLDEPACGLNHEEVDELGELIRRVQRDMNLSVLLVEHHMNLVMAVCEQIVVLNFGKKLAEGTPEAIRNSPRVVAAYLGQDAA